MLYEQYLIAALKDHFRSPALRSTEEPPQSENFMDGVDVHSFKIHHIRVPSPTS